MTLLRRSGGREVLLAFVTCLLASPALAQEPPALREHHVTLGGGVSWSGGYETGDATAQLRGNGPGASAPPFNWFTAKSHVTPAFAPDFHIGVALRHAFAVDGTISYARPRIAVAISGDAETTAHETDGEQIEEYQIGAGVSWQVPIFIHTRLAPFASIGGAYLRQLHQDRALAETGQVYHAGGGARYWLRGGDGASKSLGLRVDARINFRSGGIDFDNKMRAYPTLAVSMFLGL